MSSEEKPPRFKPPGARFIPERGPVFRFFWPLTSYFVTNIAAAAAKFFFLVPNRTIVIGRENVPEEPNTVLLPNHQSMIDGLLIGAFVFFPRSLIRPGLRPWLPAAYENFFKNPIIGWFAANIRCIPVRPGRKDFGAMKRMQAVLKDGRMIVFPEGTRSRDGGLLPPRTGIGFVMLKNRARAIPVCMDGMDRILPVGHFWPRIFDTVYLYVGKPVDLSEFFDKPIDRKTAQAAIEKAFSHVGKMKRILARYRRYRRHILSRRPFYLRLFRP